MAIPLLEEDVEVISKLGDTPGSDDGLTAQQLKARFDLAGVRIKNFLNNPDSSDESAGGRSGTAQRNPGHYAV